MPRQEQESGHARKFERWAPPSDVLCPYLERTEAGQRVLKEMDEKGFLVLPGVLSAAECDEELNRMWNFVERVAPAVDRRQPQTWSKQSRKTDRWPHAQKDMFQGHQAGWVFTALRETIAERVFEPIYGTRELLTSKDGFAFVRPSKTAAAGAQEPGGHFDQGVDMLGLQCIQASVALTDQQLSGGCFECWPGSHKWHQTLAESVGRPGDWLQLGKQQLAALRENGVQPTRVPVKRGDVILWRSDLAHQGALPYERTRDFRAVVYICMLPAQLTPPWLIEHKRRAYEQLRTGSHWPNRETWFSRDKGDFKPYLTEPPQLTRRQEELHGLRPYEEQARDLEAADQDTGHV